MTSPPLLGRAQITDRAYQSRLSYPGINGDISIMIPLKKKIHHNMFKREAVTALHQHSTLTQLRFSDSVAIVFKQFINMIKVHGL